MAKASKVEKQIKGREFSRADGLHNFRNEEKRKAAFPNGPTSLKKLKELKKQRGNRL